MSEQRKTRAVEILLVEDNPGDVRLLQATLDDVKLINRVSVARDGVEAMEFLRHEGKFAGVPNPDLVLLDWNLPRKDGREVLAEIKSDINLRSLPVIILTVSKAESDILQAYDLNADGYISKPVDLDQLMKVVRSVDDFAIAIVKQVSN